MIDFVLVSLDNYEDVSRTLESILASNLIDVRVIFIDSSHDNRIKQLSESILLDFVYIHEPPLGIYHAMNSGLKITRNEAFVWFLNPGDVISHNFEIQKLSNVMKIREINWIVVQAQHEIQSELPFPLLGSDFDSKNILTGKTRISHQAFICRSKTLQEYGMFSSNLKFTSDLDLISKVIPKELGAFLPELGVIYKVGGVSFQNLGWVRFETMKLQLNAAIFSPKYLLTSLKVITRNMFRKK